MAENLRNSCSMFDKHCEMLYVWEEIHYLAYSVVCPWLTLIFIYEATVLQLIVT